MEPLFGRPKKHHLVVSPAQRVELERIARQSRSSRSAAFRARIVLACAKGASNAGVAANLHTTGFTVGLWRNRFIAEGVAGLGDEPRPGAPREIGDEKIERLVRLTLETTPKGATHWSSRMWAAKTVLSQSPVSRIWRAFGLKPHRAEGFQLTSDPLLIDKVRDIVGLYLDPPHHLVLDNYGTHKTALVRHWLQKRTRYHLHFTPTHASWLNQVERWFALLTQRQIKRGSHTSVQELEAAIREFITTHNQQPKPFRWTKSAHQILASIARFAPSTLAAHAPETYKRNQ